MRPTAWASLKQLHSMRTSAYRFRSFHPQGSPEPLRRLRLRDPSTTAVLAANPFADCYRVRQGSFLDDSSIFDIDAVPLTSSQIDRICSTVDTGLTTPTFTPNFREVISPSLAPAPASDSMRAASISVRVDLSRLVVIILYVHADGSPKGLSFMCNQGPVQTVGDCTAEPGRVRVWDAPNLKYLVYTPSRDAHPRRPEILQVDNIWFAAHVNHDHDALEMSGKVTFQFFSTGLSLDFRPPHDPDDNGKVDVSIPWYCKLLNCNGKVLANMSENVRNTTSKQESRCKKIIRRLVKERTGKQASTKCVGYAIKGIYKRLFKRRS